MSGCDVGKASFQCCDERHSRGMISSCFVPIYNRIIFRRSIKFRRRI